MTISEPFTEIHDYVDALLAGHPVADVVVDSLAEMEIELIAYHPEVSWAVLARQPDRDAAIRLLEHRLQAALLEGTDELVIAELESPELLRDSVDEPALSQLAVRAVSALAWTEPGKAMQMYRRYYDATAMDDESEAVYRMCQGVLAVAPAWRRLANHCPVPRTLVRLMRLQWVVSGPVLDGLIANLRRDMTRRPRVYLDVCDYMSEHHDPLLRYVRRLTDRLTTGEVPRLGELEAGERERLDVAMGQLDAPMRRGVRFSHLLGVALTVGGLLSIGGFDSAALGSVVGLCALGGLYSSWTGRGRYGRMVRPHLAEFLADTGMSPGCVVSWLSLNQKAARRVKSFEEAIDADQSLDLLARLGRMARARGHDERVTDG